jgi:hypothetical protein
MFADVDGLVTVVFEHVPSALSEVVDVLHD